MTIEEGITAIKSGQTQEAISHLREELLAHPRNAEAWLWMSIALNNPEKKRDCLLRVLEIEPDNLNVKRKLAILDQNNPELVARAASMPVASRPRTLSGESAPFIATPLSRVEQVPAARPVPSQPFIMVEPPPVEAQPAEPFSTMDFDNTAGPVFTLSVPPDTVSDNPAMNVFTFETLEPVSQSLDPRTRTSHLEQAEEGKTSPLDPAALYQYSTPIPATAPLSSRPTGLPPTGPLLSATRATPAAENIPHTASRTRTWTLILILVFLFVLLVSVGAIIYWFRAAIF